MSDYNPYDLISIKVNGQDIHGRPFEFDSDIVDQKNLTNAFGSIVKPTKISSCCPDCGQGLEFDVTFGDPPFACVEVICYHCNPDSAPTADPFMNPIDDGRIAGHELDPLLHNPNEQIVGDDDGSSVADRIDFDSSETLDDDDDLVSLTPLGDDDDDDSLTPLESKYMEKSSEKSTELSDDELGEALDKELLDSLGVDDELDDKGSDNAKSVTQSNESPDDLGGESDEVRSDIRPDSVSPEDLGDENENIDKLLGDLSEDETTPPVDTATIGQEVETPEPASYSTEAPEAKLSDSISPIGESSEEPPEAPEPSVKETAVDLQEEKKATEKPKKKPRKPRKSRKKKVEPAEDMTEEVDDDLDLVD